jgi:peptide/nickel transport system substrate-binding protein
VIHRFRHDRARTVCWRALALLCLTAVMLWAHGVSAGESIRPPVLKIGLPEEPRTLNIWLASDANSNKVLSQIYQPLLVRDPKTLDFIPWLASGMPVYDPQAMTYTLDLRPARWSDGVPLTSADVVFTGQMIKTFNIPRYASKWRYIKDVRGRGPSTVVFYLSQPVANFLSGTLSAPIVAAHQWRPIARAARQTAKPLVSLLNHRIEDPIGSGPFMLAQWHRGAYLYMKANPNFFARGLTVAGETIGPNIDGLLFKIYGTADVAVLALKKGAIDMLWWGIPPGYIQGLAHHRDIEVFSSPQSALYFMGFNTRRPPFDDVTLRRAVAWLINKEFIIDRILQDHGKQMASVIPPGNTFWYNPKVKRYGQGLSRDARIRQAAKLLTGAGYRWQRPPVDADDRISAPSALLRPDGSPMPDFVILTPPADYDPHRAMSGMMIQEWLRQLGMPAFARPMNFGALLHQVKARHDFDAFILGYVHLSLDPDYLRFFFHSRNDKPNSWNMSGYHNPAFDKIADQSIVEMDPSRRQKLIWQMQDMIIHDVPYIPLYNPDLNEAVRNDHFQGWVPMIGGIGNIWSFCRVAAVKNGSLRTEAGRPGALP